MHGYVLIAVTLLSYSAFSEPHPVAASPEKSPTFQGLLTALQGNKTDSIDASVPTLVETFSGGFTATAKSASRQGKKRAVLFGYGGETIGGIGSQAGFLEFADNIDSKEGIVPYQVTFKKNADGSADIQAHPSGACVQCHTNKFVYIFKQYREWPEFLGARDDKQDPNDPDFKTLKADKRLAPFFEHAKALPGMQERSATPYFAPGEKQQLIAAPNTVLTQILVKRAARGLWNRIRFTHPERYEKVRLLLLATLRCEGAQYPPPLKNTDIVPGKKALSAEAIAEWNAIWTRFEKQFHAAVPADAKKWDAIVKAGTDKKYDLKEVPALKILDYLGIQPHQILLTQPWNGKNPLESFEDYEKLMLTYHRFPLDPENPRLASPLSFTSDLETPRKALAALIEEDTAPSYPDLKLAEDLKTFLKFMGQEPPTAPELEGAEKYAAALDKISKQDGEYGPDKDGAYCEDLRKKLMGMSFDVAQASGGSKTKPSIKGH